VRKAAGSKQQQQAAYAPFCDVQEHKRLVSFYSEWDLDKLIMNGFLSFYRANLFDLSSTNLKERKLHAEKIFHLGADLSCNRMRWGLMG
jgi:hypothetical protein